MWSITIPRPHNRDNPPYVGNPCYRCGGNWVLVPLEQWERMQLRCGSLIVVECAKCGIVSYATKIKK